tara:strand:+ start:5224 stop:6615 length:1392 start_codon:yes stop_codon:yes gene_type:complete
MFPVDIVYNCIVPPKTTDAEIADVLNYSLQTITEYLPWISTIHIITNSKTLQLFIAQDLTIPINISPLSPIDLQLPEQSTQLQESQLSKLLECNIHNKVELSDNFIYMKPNMCFTRPCVRRLFFNTSGHCHAYINGALPSTLRQVHQQQSITNTKSLSDNALSRFLTHNLLADYHGTENKKRYYDFKNQPCPLSKKLMRDVWKINHFDAARKQLLRPHSDTFSPLLLILNHGLLVGLCIKSSAIYHSTIRLSNADTTTKLKRELSSSNHTRSATIINNMARFIYTRLMTQSNLSPRSAIVSRKVPMSIIVQETGTKKIKKIQPINFLKIPVFQDNDNLEGQHNNFIRVVQGISNFVQPKMNAVHEKSNSNSLLRVAHQDRITISKEYKPTRPQIMKNTKKKPVLPLLSTQRARPIHLSSIPVKYTGLTSEPHDLQSSHQPSCFQKLRLLPPRRQKQRHLRRPI